MEHSSYIVPTLLLYVPPCSDPKTGEPSRLQSRGVEAGDLLVAINAVPVEGMAPKDVRILLQAQSRPLRLVFRPHDEAPRVIPGLFAPEAPKCESATCPR